MCGRVGTRSPLAGDATWTPSGPRLVSGVAVGGAAVGMGGVIGCGRVVTLGKTATSGEACEGAGVGDALASTGVADADAGVTAAPAAGVPPCSVDGGVPTCTTWVVAVEVAAPRSAEPEYRQMNAPATAIRQTAISTATISSGDSRRARCVGRARTEFAA